MAADLGAFEELCSLLEALALDDNVRLLLMCGPVFPDEHDGAHCLGEMLKSIDCGDYHPPWKDMPGDVLQHGCMFDFCKAALIKAVVGIAGEEKNIDVL